VSAIKRRNSISEQFAARTIPMLESPAYRMLSLSAHKVISRLEIELAHHGGNDNGKLPVTTDQFVEYGMHRTSVAPAIREAEALGSFVLPSGGAVAMPSTGRQTNSSLRLRTVATAAAFRPRTIGGGSRRSRRPSRSPAPLVPIRTNVPSNTASETG
jgi:hypothetical protein